MRGAIIRGLTRALLAHVPPINRTAARVLFAAIEDQWVEISNHNEAQAYQRGVQEGTPAKSAEDAGLRGDGEPRTKRPSIRSWGTLAPPPDAPTKV